MAKPKTIEQIAHRHSAAMHDSSSAVHRKAIIADALREYGESIAAMLEGRAKAHRANYTELGDDDTYTEDVAAEAKACAAAVRKHGEG